MPLMKACKICGERFRGPFGVKMHKATKMDDIHVSARKAGEPRPAKSGQLLVELAKENKALREEVANLKDELKKTAPMKLHPIDFSMLTTPSEKRTEVHYHVTLNVGSGVDGR